MNIVLIKKKWFQKSKLKLTIRFVKFEIQSCDRLKIRNHMDGIVIKLFRSNLISDISHNIID